LPDSVLSKIFDAYQNEPNKDAKSALGLILENAKMANENRVGKLIRNI
jgi:tartrate dehydratase alpha subunit/fumarate hydratase class I-like protein